MPIRAVLWDADGVVQRMPVGTWEIAVRIVSEFPHALTGGPIDEAGVRRVAHVLGFGARVDDIVAVWTDFDLVRPCLATVAQVRAAGTACYLATNQDAFRAARMRGTRCYRTAFDGAFYSCDLGVAKPDVAFFEQVCESLDLAPDRLLFIDDQLRNVDGARAAGLQAERWTHDEGTSRLKVLLADHGVLDNS